MASPATTKGEDIPRPVAASPADVAAVPVAVVEEFALPAKVFTEFVGTLAIALVSSMATGFSNPFATAGAYIAVTYAGAHISDGHFNPAVTLAVMLMNTYKRRVKKDRSVKIRFELMIAYLAVQIIGGAVGVGLGSVAFGAVTTAPAPGVGHTIGEAFTAELIFSTAMVHVYLLSLYAEGTIGNNFFGLAIGLTLLGGKGASANISGGIFNPAISVGLIMANADQAEGENVWLYIVAPLLGSAIALLPYALEEVVEHDHKHAWTQRLSRFCAEFWGTGLIAYVAALSQGTSFGVAELSIGAMVAGQTYANGFVSGALLHPGTTLARTVVYSRVDENLADASHNRSFRRQIEDLFGCWLFQFGAAIMAGGVASANLVDTEPYATPAAGVTNFRAMVAEWLLSTVFMYIYLLVTAKSSYGGIYHYDNAVGARGNSYFGLAIGFAYFAVILAGRAFVGISLNPAMVLGLAIGSGNSMAFDSIWIYLVSGLVLAPWSAALLFRVTHEPDCLLAGVKHSFAALRGPVFEFVGSFFLAMVSNLLGASVSTQVGVAIGAYVLATHYAGVTYTGYYNPAVTFMMWLTKRAGLTARDLVIYGSVQFIGAILGAVVAGYVSGVHPVPTPVEITSEGVFKEFLIEFLVSFVLLIAVCSSLGLGFLDGNGYSGYVYGFGTMAAVVALPNRITTLFNPAVAAGNIVANGTATAGGYSWIYIMGPLLGAAFAALIYFLTHKDFYGTEAPWLRRTRSVFHELWGTAFFTLVSAMVLSPQYKLGAFAIGGTYMILLYACTYEEVTATGDSLQLVNAAHFNPIISLGTELHRFFSGHWRTPWIVLFLKVLAQFVGAFIGAGFAAYFLGIEFAPQVAASTTLPRVFFAEMFFVFLLVVIQLNVAPESVGQGNNQHFGLAVGFGYIGSVACIAPLSGSVLNPAVAGALAAVNGTTTVANDFYVFLVAPIIGMALAYIYYRVTANVEYAHLAAAKAIKKQRALQQQMSFRNQQYGYQQPGMQPVGPAQPTIVEMPAVKSAEEQAPPADDVKVEA